MKAADVMTVGAATVRADSSVVEAARRMLQYGISGLPVVDENDQLVGIVTERDFLRRAELGTERHRPRWIQVLLGPGAIADDYVRSHGRKVSEVMTTEVATVAADTPLDEVVDIMERWRIKRVPVVRDGKVIGMVSRANLVRRLARLGDNEPQTAASDDAIRREIVDGLAREAWGPQASLDVQVRDGVVTLRGAVSDSRVRDAVRVLAENASGVKRIEDEITVLEGLDMGWP